VPKFPSEFRVSQSPGAGNLNIALLYKHNPTISGSNPTEFGFSIVKRKVAMIH